MTDAKPPEASAGTTKLAAEVRAIVAELLKDQGPVTDKKGFGQRWMFSPRHVDTLLTQGLPHLKVGERRVRIVITEGDRWMVERFGVQRLTARSAKTKAAKQLAV